MEPTVTGGMIFAYVLIALPILAFAASWISGALRARRENARDAFLISKRLTEVENMPRRVSHADMLRDFAEYGDRQEAQLRAKYGDDRKGAA